MDGSGEDKKICSHTNRKISEHPFLLCVMIDLNSMEFLVIHLIFYKKICACRHTKIKITEDPFLFYVIIVLSFVYFLVCIHL